MIRFIIYTNYFDKNVEERMEVDNITTKYFKNNEAGSLPYTIYKKNKGLNERAKTIKLKQKHEGKLHDIGFANYFLNMTSKAQEKNK